MGVTKYLICPMQVRRVALPVLPTTAAIQITYFINSMLKGINNYGSLQLKISRQVRKLYEAMDGKVINFQMGATVDPINAS